MATAREKVRVATTANEADLVAFALRNTAGHVAALAIVFDDAGHVGEIGHALGLGHGFGFGRRLRLGAGTGLAGASHDDNKQKKPHATHGAERSRPWGRALRGPTARAASS